MNSKISTALKSPSPITEERMHLLNQAQLLVQAGDPINEAINQKTQKLNCKYILPLQVMATEFSLDMLQEQKPVVPLNALIEKTVTFHQMASRALGELKLKSHQLKEKEPTDDMSYSHLNKPLETMQKLIDNLDTALDIPDLMEDADEETQRTMIEKKLNDAIEKFKDGIENDVITAQPPKPLMNIVLRVLRAIFTLSFSLTNNPEKEDQKRFDREVSLKDELSNLKKEHMAEKEQEPEPTALSL
jgi:hypothetical protein